MSLQAALKTTSACEEPLHYCKVKLETLLKLLATLLCLLSYLPTVFSDAASHTTMFTSKGAIVTPEPGSSTQNEEIQNPLKTGFPTPAATTSSFPYLQVSELTLEQQEGHTVRLCVESEDIVHKFSRLHSRVYESLCERNVSVDKLVAHLLSLHALDPVYKGSQKPVFQTFFQNVMYIIKDYISFFNYCVIAHIVVDLVQIRTKLSFRTTRKNLNNIQSIEFMNVHHSMGLRTMLIMLIQL